MGNYKFTPLIVEKDKNGKILIDEEKLKELLREVYNNGYADGQLANSKEVSPTTIPSQPYTPTPYYPDIVPTTPTVPSPYWYENWYCISESWYEKSIKNIRNSLTYLMHLFPNSLWTNEKGEIEPLM